MIRVFFFLFLVCAVALAGAWIADRPGEIAINWLGWRIETSVMVATVALLVLTFLLTLIWSALRFLVRSPRAVTNAMYERRRRKGYLAISQGLIAVGSGHTRAARKFATEAQ